MKELVSIINSIRDACDRVNGLDRAVEDIMSMYRNSENKDIFALALTEFAVEQRKMARIFGKITAPEED